MCDLVLGEVPGSQVVTDVGAELSFILPSTATHHFPALFDSLEGQTCILLTIYIGGAWVHAQNFRANAQSCIFTCVYIDIMTALVLAWFLNEEHWMQSAIVTIHMHTYALNRPTSF